MKRWFAAACVFLLLLSLSACGNDLKKTYPTPSWAGRWAERASSETPETAPLSSAPASLPPDSSSPLVTEPANPDPPTDSTTRTAPPPQETTTAAPAPTWPVYTGPSIPREGSDPDIQITDSAIPLEQLLKTEVDIHQFVETYCLPTGDVWGSGTLADIAADPGIECLRATEAGSLYSVHRVEQGGRLYIFYHRRQTAEQTYMMCWYYETKALSHKDFSSIQEGSTIGDVIRIDPAAQVHENLYRAAQGYWDDTGGFGTWHYLDDGILEIDYQNIGGELTVQRLTFREDFLIVRNSWAVTPIYDGHLLPGDKLPQ